MINRTWWTKIVSLLSVELEATSSEPYFFLTKVRISIATSRLNYSHLELNVKDVNPSLQVSIGGNGLPNHIPFFYCGYS